MTTGTAILPGCGWLSSNPNYTIQNTGTGSLITTTDNIVPTVFMANGDCEITGKLKVGGKDLSDTLTRIEQRLAILHRNNELEEQWEKLREIAEQYRVLEQEILEKEKIHQILSR